VSGFLETLRARGFIADTTDDERLAALFASGRPVTAYIGFDPSASSLHVGSLVQIMALVHLQRAGHRPLAVVGGGTGRVGDPSGKSELRKVLATDEIAANLDGLRAQLSRFFDVAPAGVAPSSANQGLIVDNADWLLGLDYVDFLRDIGRFFSVNRMLAAESVKLRLESESGLSFLEFNYSILQAYDFLVLFQRYGCQVQMGGRDQWGNIVAGIDLVRRVEGKPAYGITTPLITTASGGKMGKTEAGAVWLDAARTSPYDYYQFWINSDDRDAGRFLRLFTLLPLAEIEALEKLEGAAIRAAKESLAFAATALNHGEDEAARARDAARALFGGGDADAGGSAVPAWSLARSVLDGGVPAVAVFHDCGLCESRGAARRMARQGGLYAFDVRVEEDRVFTTDDLRHGALLLRAGKKKHRRIEVE